MSLFSQKRRRFSFISVSSLGILGSLSSANLAQAVPKSESTSLPVTAAMFNDPSLKEVLEFLPSLTVFQDSTDPSQYFYLPPMRAVEGIAATALVNDAQIGRSDQVAKLRRKIQGLAGGDYLFLQAQYQAVMSRIAGLKPEEVSFKPVLESIAETIKADYEKATQAAQDYERALPAGLKKTMQEGIAEELGSAGFSVSDPSSVRERATLEGRLNRSNGGLFTANVFSGFYRNEVSLVKKYHEARAKLGLQHLKISLMPLESFTWAPLAETALRNDGTETEDIPLFRKIQGGGNLTGATVNIDLTLDGARKFAKNLGPVILPIYGKAKLIKKYPAFRATLKCDFTTGWKVQGRTDVRDGLIIYNNDVTTDMVAEDISTTATPCRVTVDGGGGSEEREAAIRASIEKVKERLASLFFSRTHLAKNEKDSYFNGVMTDIQNNRHSGANDGWTGVATSYLGGGWAGVFVSGVSQASNFYWHTNIQKVRSLSQVKWEEEILENGNSRVEQEIPTNICLAYNPSKAGYVACSETEKIEATSVTKAAEAASKSPVCMTAEDSVECGLKRASEGPTNPSTGNLLPDEL
jgi:hypothetical protein